MTDRARGHGFRIGQIGSASMVSLAHGTNDAQKTMGVITLALIVNKSIPRVPRGCSRRRLHPAVRVAGQPLTDTEVAEVANELASESDPDSAEAIRKAIGAVTNEKPLDSDVARVRARLAAGGWPLAKPHHL